MYKSKTQERNTFLDFGKKLFETSFLEAIPLTSDTGKVHGTLLLPLLRLNQTEEAARLHKIGYKLISNSTALLGTISDHLLFLEITGEIAKVIKLLEKHFTSALRAPSFSVL